MRKVYLTVIAGAVTWFALIWTFNHVNPWVSIGLVAVIIYLIIHKNTKKK